VAQRPYYCMRLQVNGGERVLAIVSGCRVAAGGVMSYAMPLVDLSRGLYACRHMSFVPGPINPTPPQTSIQGAGLSWVWVVPSGSGTDGHFNQDLVTDAVEVARGAQPPPSRRSLPLLVILDAVGTLPARWLAKLDRIRSRYPTVRLILLASFDRLTVSTVLHLTAVEVFWEDQVDELYRLIDLTAQREVRGALASFLTSHAHSDPIVAEAIGLVLRAEAPIGVAALARKLHLSQSALRKRWRRSNLPGSPRVLTDWLVVCALEEARRMGMTVEALALQLGVHETTLYRASHRVLECPPGEVEPHAIMAAARRWASGS
jgi:transposase-like protein